jgi:hypothetical protein
MAVKQLTFKALASWASHTPSLSARAAKAAQGVLCEISVWKPTVDVMSMVCNASRTSIHKATRITPYERVVMANNGLTLGDFEDKITVREDDVPDTSIPTEPLLVYEKNVPHRITVDDVLTAITGYWSPSEVLVVGRFLGVDHVWLPSQRRKR